MVKEKMVRKQFYIEPEHDALLKQYASMWGVTEAELIRHAIELLKQSWPPNAVRNRAWEEIKAFSRERAKLNVPQTGRSWRREDAYAGPRFDKWRSDSSDEPTRPPDQSIRDI